MVQHMIVPVDGSDASWRAVDTAIALGRRCDASLNILEVVFADRDFGDAEARVADRLGQHDSSGVDVSTMAKVATSAAAAISEEIDRLPDALVVMASHGRGRSAALLGSVTEDLLQRIYGPILVVGPRCTKNDFSGPIIVTVDGSEASEGVLPLAAAWGIEVGVDPWVVEVADPDITTPADVSESAYPARLARKLSNDSGHVVHFEMLHGKHVHDEVVSFADNLKASLIVASTHGRTGMSRLVIGSTAAGFVHHASCPVLLVRPPHLSSAHKS
jgi:nucleotide-binding universal stress UspA family protein